MINVKLTVRVIPCRLILILLVLFFFSCKPATESKSKFQESDLQKIENINKIREVYYRFPDPQEMFQIIRTNDLTYNSDLLHSPKFEVNYLDSKKQCLNLGIYIADLAFITAFQQHQDALQYFDVIYKLSDKLRISAAFKPSLIKRFENNMQNADSLRILADDAMNSISGYLSRNQKDKTFAMMSIGGFIETMHLSFLLAGDYSDSNQIIQRIKDQKVVLNNLVSFTEQYANDMNIAESLELLKPLQQLYAELKVIDEETRVTKAEDGRLIISGGLTVEITEQQFNKIRDVVNFARNEVISE